MLPAKQLGLHLIGYSALALAQEAAERSLPIWQMDLPDPLDAEARSRFADLRAQHPVPLVIRIPPLRETLLRGNLNELCEQVVENVQEARLWQCDLVLLPLGTLPREEEIAHRVRQILDAVAPLGVVIEPTRIAGFGSAVADIAWLIRGQPDPLGVSLSSLWLLGQGALADEQALARWSESWERQVGWDRVVLLKLNDTFAGKPAVPGSGEVGTHGIRLLLGHPHLARVPWLTEVSPRLFAAAREALWDAR